MNDDRVSLWPLWIALGGFVIGLAVFWAVVVFVVG